MLVTQVLHANQGFLLVLERRLFDQLRVAAGAVDQGVVLVRSQFDRHALAADLGGVVTTWQEAEVAAGLGANLLDLGVADRGCSRCAGGVVQAHEGRAFRCARAIQRGVGTGEGLHGGQGQAGCEGEGFGNGSLGSHVYVSSDQWVVRVDDKARFSSDLRVFFSWAIHCGSKLLRSFFIGR
ncbi:hypothetical protein D3C78_1309110 [compost metagenome]